MLYYITLKEIILLSVFIFAVGGFIYKTLFSDGDMDGQGNNLDN